MGYEARLKRGAALRYMPDLEIAFGRSGRRDRLLEWMMIDWVRRGAKAAAIVAGGLALAACSTTGSGVTTTNIATSEQLAPMQTSSVSTEALPPIGQDGMVASAPLDAPGQIGDPAQPGAASDPTLQTADADGSFVTLDAVGQLPNASGRDLTGGLTVEKLLGGWTIVSGADQCRLNLTQTTKTGTNRYRASTPACQLAGLKLVVSWQLAGSQVQLFDENGDIVAALILSGNRFIGTLAGGQGISMVG